MKQRYEGSITIYLGISIIIILGLICTIIESGRQIALNARLQEVTYMSQDAVFSEYIASLFNKYGIMVLYKTPDQIEKKMQYYENFNLGNETNLGNNLNLLKARAKNINISDITFLTDNGGEAFINQVKEYMQYNFAQELYGDLSKSAMGVLIKENHVMPSFSEGESSDGLEAAYNILDEIIGLINTASLSLVTDVKYISDKSVNMDNLASKTAYNDGDYQTDLLGKTALNKYISSKFSCFRDESQDNNKPLDYEMEYILSGAKSDKENLAAVVRKLIFLRQGINYAYVIQDKVKCAEAQGLATVIGGVSLQPELILPIKHCLLLAWSYVEGIADVRELLAGNSMGMIKQADEWKTSIEGIFGAAKSVENIEGIKKAGQMDYKAYLELLLLQKNDLEKSFRAMDVIQLNISYLEGCEFLIKNAIVSYEAEVTYEGSQMFLNFAFVKNMLGNNRSGFIKKVNSVYSY